MKHSAPPKNELRLPGILGVAAAAGGVEAAAALARAKGGEVIYVPSRFREGHELTRIVGPAAAKAIVRHYGGDKIAVGTGRMNKRTRDAVRAIEAKKSNNEIAHECGITSRTVTTLRRLVKTGAIVALLAPAPARARPIDLRQGALDLTVPMMMAPGRDRD